MITPAQKAKSKLDMFSARGSNCPLCGKSFRNGCNHSVQEAKNKLFENYIKVIAHERHERHKKTNSITRSP